MNETLTVENASLRPLRSGRSTPIHLHQRIVSAFVFGLAAKAFWRGSWGLGIYKQEEREIRTRAENRSGSSKTAVVFASRPRWPQIFNTSLLLATSQRWMGTMVLLAQSGLCLVEMISLTFAPRRRGEFFPVCNWSFTDWRDVKP